MAPPHREVTLAPGAFESRIPLSPPARNSVPSVLSSTSKPGTVASSERLDPIPIYLRSFGIGSMGIEEMRARGEQKEAEENLSRQFTHIDLGSAG